MQQSSSQGVSYYNPKYLRYDDFVYEDNIRTVQLYRGGNPLSYPHIFVNDPQTFVLEFDELYGKMADYTVSFVHCDADWNPSSLVSNEFMNGLGNDRISVVQSSVNTYIPYMHYRYEFPNNLIGFRRSGNYLLKVYSGFDEGNLILTRRFVIAENLIPVITDIGLPVSPEKRNKYHQINLTLDIRHFPVDNIFSDLKIILMKNGRWDNTVPLSQPSYISKDKIEYDFSTNNIFLAGNECRRLDLSSSRLVNERIKNIEDDGKQLHVYTYPDKSRNFSRYFTNLDFNGMYAITTLERTNPSVFGQYMNVTFSLLAPGPIFDGNVYLFGSVSGWKTLSSCKMIYDEEKELYSCMVLLKQGVYDYMYVVREDHKNIVDEERFEGSYAETENNYSVLVYHKSFTDKTHCLAGMSTRSFRW